MASEPKRPVEKMIEALAKARRGEFGDDPSMPNPMRARLHVEVSATAKDRAGLAENERANTRPSWLTMFWPRLAVAAATATLLVLVPAIWWNKTHRVASSGQLASRDSAAARNEESKPPAPEDALLKGSAAAGAPASSVNLADNSQVRIEPEATPGADVHALEESNRLAEARSARALPDQVTKGYVSKERAAQPRAAAAAAPLAGQELKTESDKVAAASAPVAPAAATDGGAARRQFSQNLGAQSFRNNVQLKQTANLLNTFQVEQRGTEIRVLDSDGSTYTGKIEQVAQNEKLAAMRAKRSSTSPLKTEVASPEAQSYFRATGFNVSLKKNVVFEGNYTEAPPPGQSLTANKPAQAQAQQQQQQQRQDRARIVGEARVNGEKPVQVDAVAESDTR